MFEGFCFGFLCVYLELYFGRINILFVGGLCILENKYSFWGLEYPPNILQPTKTSLVPIVKEIMPLPHRKLKKLSYVEKTAFVG